MSCNRHKLRTGTFSAWKYLSFVWVFIASSWLYASEAPRTILFFRPIRDGDSFRCDLQLNQQRTYKVSDRTGNLPESGRKNRDTRSVRIELNGLMRVKTALYGHPAEVTFEVTTFRGTVDGTAVPFRLDGTVLAIDMRNPEGSVIRVQAEDKQLTAEEERLLGQIFRPVRKENLADLMGNPKPISPGDEWAVPGAVLIDALKARGIQIEPDQIKGQVRYSGNESIEGIPCQVFKENVRIEGVTGFSFVFTAAVWLPENPEISPVKIIRTATEESIKSLPDDNPLTRDMTIGMLLREEFTAVTLPGK